MLKIYKILIIAATLAFSLTLSNASEEFNKENYPFKAHEKIHFDCKNCHKEKDPKEYKAVTTKQCLNCHKSYNHLAEQTSHLGYDNNIHASPHYMKMDCNICHNSHKKSKNFCVMCHSQDKMKNLLVP